MRRATAVAAVLGCALVLAGGSAAHYPSIAYRPPVFGPEGDLYLAGGAGYVYSLQSDGTVRWTHGVGGEPTDQPTVHRGDVVVPTVDGRVVAAHVATGTRTWATDVGDRRGRYRTTAAEGTIYVAGPGGVTALGVADGATQWTTTLDRPVVAGPVEAADRIVVATGRGGDARLVALDAGGDVAWRVPLPDDVRALATRDGRVLVASGGTVRAVDEAGDRVWQVRTGEVSGLSAADGGAVVGTYNGTVVRVRDGAVAWRAHVNVTAVAPAPGPAGEDVYAVTPEAVVGVRDGAVQWRTRVGLTVLAPPTVGRLVYVGTQVNRTYALDRSGEVRWVDRFATPVGAAPEVDHGVAPPPFLAAAAGTPTRVVHSDGTTERPGGPLDLSGVTAADLVALAALVALAVGMLAVRRRWD